ncbi:probable leucine-rich repeat receptor-like protein kinase At1g35710 [Lycium barbarum]|uniref:probable leucine-rich repeat receptor-like protein kinase At1g35710 n=1 Tax=Lycium barbarum TaxID=112863 RepID=UPI00293E7CE0|nr:probable leucine-rich repeat receptor-like protein kinase At1g35710 [Lycium barbarum]
MEKAFTSFRLILLLLHYVMASSTMIQTNISTDQLALLSLKSEIISDPFHFLDESWKYSRRDRQSSKHERFAHTIQSACSIPLAVFNISRIEVIAFTSNYLSGTLPNHFGNGFPILKGLYLSINKLHGHTPTSLSNCSELQILPLSGNEFDGPIHREIGRLSNLQKLFLGSNHFTGMTLHYLMKEVGNLVNLMDLGMERNQITGSIPISMFNISSLQYLLLAKNNLKGSLPWEIGNLTKMQVLYLNENRFNGEIPKDISNLVELEELGLEFNSFSGSLKMESFNISRLRIISLLHNNLSGIIPPNICSVLPNIEHLYLDKLTNLFGIIPHSISNC